MTAFVAGAGKGNRSGQESGLPEVLQVGVAVAVASDIDIKNINDDAGWCPDVGVRIVTPPLIDLFEVDGRILESLTTMHAGDQRFLATGNERKDWPASPGVGSRTAAELVIHDGRQSSCQPPG